MRSKSSSVSKAQYQTRHPTGPAKDFFREPSIQGSAPLTSHGPRPQWKPLLLSCYPSQIKCRPCARALCPSEEIDSFKREGLSGGGPQPSQGPCRERHGGGQGAIAASPARILRTRRTPLQPGLRSALALGLSYPVALSWPTSCESALSSAGREICRGFTRQDTEITTRQLGLSSGLSHLPWQPASHWVPGRRRWPRGQLVSSLFFYLPGSLLLPHPYYLKPPADPKDCSPRKSGGF